MKTLADKTDEILVEMLTENTGSHMLDSGGAYGRHWQRNQSASGDDPLSYFRSRPEGEIDTWGGVTVDVFKFLSQRLEHAERLDRAWSTWVHIGPMSRYTNGYTDAEEFVSQLTKKGWADGAQDFHGTTINTYNGEDALSQTLQYTLMYLNKECPWVNDRSVHGEGYYVLLSIHGGADVRGGYSDLRAFYLGDWERMTELLDNAYVEIGCSQCGWMGQSYNAGYEYEYYDCRTWEQIEKPAASNDEHDHRLCPACNSELWASGRPVG